MYSLGSAALGTVDDSQLAKWCAGKNNRKIRIKKTKDSLSIDTDSDNEAFRQDVRDTTDTELLKVEVEIEDSGDSEEEGRKLATEDSREVVLKRAALSTE